MASLTLTTPDVGLFADFAATRIAVPVVLLDDTETGDEALVHFDGDEFPTSYRGPRQTTSVQVSCRFGEASHADLIAMSNLLAAARVAPDGRLLLRSTAGIVAGWDRTLLVGTVASRSRRRLSGRAWEVGFLLNVTAHTVEV